LFIIHLMIFKIVYGKEIHVLNKQVSYSELLAFVRSAFKKLPKNYTLSYVDTEGDNIAITSQSDIDILALGQGASASVRILITENEEVPDEQDRSFEELEEPKSVKNEEFKGERRPEFKQEAEPQQMDIASMIQSRIAEIIPEIAKKVTEEVTSSMSKSTISEQPKAESIKSPSSTVVHEHVTCDSCGKFPIVGIRYKCSICHNYDFCEECEARGDHPHAFLKIRTPNQAPKVLIASMEGDAEGVEINGKFMDVGFFKNIIDSYAPRIPEFVEKFKKCAKRCKKAAEEKKEVDKKTEEKKVVVEDDDVLFPMPEKKVEEPPKVEVPKVEEPKVEPPKEPKKSAAQIEIEQENQQIAMAYELEQILEVDFFKVLRFIKKFPKLSKEDLVMKYFEHN
jgi:hypothetical protein